MPRYQFRFLVQGCLTAQEDLILEYGGRRVKFLVRERVDQEHFEVELDADGPEWKAASSTLIDETIPAILDVLSFRRKSPFLTDIPTRVVKSEEGSERRRAILINQRREPNFCWTDQRSFGEVEAGIKTGFGHLPQGVLRWLRNSYRPLPIRDTFVFAWLSLEVLAGERVVQKICQNCGFNNGQYETSNHEAAREIVRRWRPDIGGGTFWRWARELRNAVFHGDRIPGNLLTELRDATHVVVECVEREVNQHFDFNFQLRPGAVIDFESLYYRHHFVEFETAHPERGFAEDVPDVIRLEDAIEHQRDPASWLPVHVLSPATSGKENH